MATAVGDVIQIIDVQTYLLQTVQNVYEFFVYELTGTVTLEEIALEWVDTVLTPVRNIQADDINHDYLAVKNLSNGVDIWDETTNLPGVVVSTNPSPSFVAVGIQLLRSTAITRHGGKRISGISDDNITGNSLVGVALTNMPALLTALSAELNVVGADGTASLYPVIVGRYPQGSPNAGEMDLSKLNPIQGAQFKRVTTQNTRKAGRGI